MVDRRLAVSAPGSTANLGPGFDVLGLAVGLRATVGTGPAPVGAHVVDEHHPGAIAYRQAGGVAPTLWGRSELPMGRGLGFSGAVRVAGSMLAIVEQRGKDAASDPDCRSRAFDIAASLEGHPDNAAASMFGGMVIAGPDGTVVPVPLQLDAAVLVWIPEATTSTDQSRTRLATTVDRTDAVANLAAIASLIIGCATGDRRALRAGCRDRLHQPARLAAVPESSHALDAMLEHGALAAWLSGSGPTVAAFVERSSVDTITTSLDVGTVRLLEVDDAGVIVESFS